MATLIVDGHYMLHRVMHLPALGFLRNGKGMKTGGVLGFLKSLRFALNEKGPFWRCVIVWDTARSPRRLSLYPEYKAHRRVDKCDEEHEEYMNNFQQQRIILRKLLGHLCVTSVELPDKEGDDLLWFVTWLLRKHRLELASGPVDDQETVLLTDDRDMLQLVDEHVSVFRPIADEFVTVDNFEELVGVPLERYLLFRALVGDSSDNIVGIKGIGPKTATKLVAECVEPSVDGLMELLEGDKSAKAKLVLGNLGKVALNLELMDLKLERFSSNDEEIVKGILGQPRILNSEEVLRYLFRLEFRSIMDKFTNWVIPFRALWWMNKAACSGVYSNEEVSNVGT